MEYVPERSERAPRVGSHSIEQIVGRDHYDRASCDDGSRQVDERRHHDHRPSQRPQNQHESGNELKPKLPADGGDHQLCIFLLRRSVVGPYDWDRAQVR